MEKSPPLWSLRRSSRARSAPFSLSSLSADAQLVRVMRGALLHLIALNAEGNSVDAMRALDALHAIHPIIAPVQLAPVDRQDSVALPQGRLLGSWEAVTRKV